MLTFYDVVDARTFRVMAYGLTLSDAQKYFDAHDHGTLFVIPNGMTFTEIRRISLLLNR